MARVRLFNVSKRFGDTVAVAHVTMEVAEGEMVTLLGPSGCGKTTTLRMIAGLIEPTEGEIYFDDQLMNHIPPNRRNIGFVFQTHALFPHMTVAENIAFGLKVKRRPKTEIEAKVQEMLSLINLEGYEDRYPSQLSGGQQQRVALARVLAIDPRVLLFDEPLSALDRNLRDTLKYNILELQRKTGKTAIYVTHDQSEAFAISDRVFVMNEGRVEQVGTQLDVYLHPQTQFVATFIGSNNTMRGRVTRVEESPDGERIVVVQCTPLEIRARDPLGLQPGEEVMAYVRPENIEVLEGDQNRYLNRVEGKIEQIVFEGATLHFTANVDGQLMSVELGGRQRLQLLGKEGYQVHLGFNEVTLIRA